MLKLYQNGSLQISVFYFVRTARAKIVPQRGLDRLLFPSTLTFLHVIYLAVLLRALFLDNFHLASDLEFFLRVPIELRQGHAARSGFPFPLLLSVGQC